MAVPLQTHQYSTRPRCQRTVTKFFLGLAPRFGFRGMAPRRVAIPWHTCQRYCTHYYFFDSAPLGGIGYCLELRSSELASPRHRRRLFVSLSLHKSAMPVSSGSLAPLVKVALTNTQPRWRCAPAVISRGHYLARESPGTPSPAHCHQREQSQFPAGLVLASFIVPLRHVVM